MWHCRKQINCVNYNKSTIWKKTPSCNIFWKTRERSVILVCTFAYFDFLNSSTLAKYDLELIAEFHKIIRNFIRKSNNYHNRHRSTLTSYQEKNSGFRFYLKSWHTFQSALFNAPRKTNCWAKNERKRNKNRQKTIMLWFGRMEIT